MILAVVLLNGLVNNVAVLLILSVMVNSPKQKYILAFALMTLANLLLIQHQYWILPAITLITFLVFSPGQVGYQRTFYKCLSTVFLIWCYVTIVSSVYMLALPKSYGGAGYNLILCGALIVFALVLKFNSWLLGAFQGLEHVGYAVAVELIVLGFFTFVMPYLYSVVDGRPRILAIYTKT